MSNEKQTSEQKPKGPFPHPAKNMTGDRATDETDAPRNPARAPGKRLLDREDDAAASGEGKDASGDAPDTAPQQSRETRRNQH